jgi:hypothetical protein
MISNDIEETFDRSRSAAAIGDEIRKLMEGMDF